MSTIKTIHSRSNKNIGDFLEEDWEIIAKRIIAEPCSGDPNKAIAPRLGIYEYELKSAVQSPAVKPTGTKRQNEPRVGGTRREASSVPVTVRRTS